MVLLYFQCPSRDHVESSLDRNNGHQSHIIEDTGKASVSAREINLTAYLQVIQAKYLLLGLNLGQ